MGAAPPGGKAWQMHDDFEAFGILRFGFGRVSSCYHRADFIEILHWVINGYEEHQHLIIGGIRLLEARLQTEILQNSQARTRLYFDLVRFIGKKEGKLRCA